MVDDVHELGSAEALRQLELLLMRAPPELRFVLATRHDVRLGLHRLRLEGELTEIRADDLRFTLAEARALFEAAGVELPEPALALLHERTEGWAAGLRLAALSLAGHPDPERFAAEFSGSERTVAEYLLAEVLERQSEQVRRLLLRTSVLERVNGELADLLTGGSGGERVLAGSGGGERVRGLAGRGGGPGSATTRCSPTCCSWSCAAPRRGVTALHRAAAGWFAGHGYPVEAIRHAQAAQDWDLAARLLADHWPGLYLDGQAATVHELLAGFPAGASAADAELAALVAADELAQGSLEEAERYLALAERGSASVPDAPARAGAVLLGVVRLLLARQRGDLQAVAEEAQRLQAVAEAPEAALPGLGEELRALALISLGIAEVWAARLDEAQRHLEQGIALARRIGRPFLEFTGLAYLAGVEALPVACAGGGARQAGDRTGRTARLDRRPGRRRSPTWYSHLDWSGRGASRRQKAGSSTPSAPSEPEADPAAAMGIHYIRGLLELARGRDHEAVAAFRAAERLAGLLPAPHVLLSRTWALHVARPGTPRRAGAYRAGSRRPRRAGPRTRGDPHRHGGAAARPG